MKPGGLTMDCPQGKEGIVVRDHFPEICRQMAFHRREIAEEPAGEIDEVHALINQFTASRQLRVSSPFFVVANTPAVPVAGADEHQLSKNSSLKDLACLLKSGMVAMVVA